MCRMRQSSVPCAVGRPVAGEEEEEVVVGPVAGCETREKANKT
jgi:hypothetical protein